MSTPENEPTPPNIIKPLAVALLGFAALSAATLLVFEQAPILLPLCGAGYTWLGLSAYYYIRHINQID